MVRDFKITDEAHIGYYASLITSAFAMAQFISGMYFLTLTEGDLSLSLSSCYQNDDNPIISNNNS